MWLTEGQAVSKICPVLPAMTYTNTNAGYYSQPVNTAPGVFQTYTVPPTPTTYTAPANCRASSCMFWVPKRDYQHEPKKGCCAHVLKYTYGFQKTETPPSV